MADTLSTSLQLIQQVALSNAGAWNVNVEINWSRIEQAITGILSKAVTGGTDTLTSAEQRNAVLIFTGTLASNETVVVGDYAKSWDVHNNTSGAYTLTVKTASGTGIVVSQGGAKRLYCDGTNVEEMVVVATFPISDANGLVYDAGDATAIVRIDAGAITTGTTRVLTMADADIDLDLSSGSFQPRDAGLVDIAGLAVTDGNIIVGDGANWVAESGATARASLGLAIGTDVQAQQTIGIADNNLLEVDGSPNSGEVAMFTANGLEGLTEGEFKTAFNMEAGTDYQGYHARLADIVGLTYAQGDILYHNGSNLVNLGPGTSGQYLQTQGAGANPVWATAAGSGDVVKVGTPVNNQIGVWTGDGTLEGDAALTFDGSYLSFHEATNDGNPSFQLGATTSEQLHIQAFYDTGAQTLDYVSIHTETASGSADKGLVRFNIDGANILDIDDDGIEVTGSIIVNATAAAQASLSLAEDTDNGSNVLVLQPPAALTSDVTLTFPDGAGSANQTLISNGSGVLSWVTPGLLATAAEWTAAQNFDEASLTSTSNSVAWNAATAQVATHTLTENTTIASPTNIPAGRMIALRVIQHASSAKTLAWNSSFKWASGVTPTMTTSLSGVDIYTFWSDGSNLHQMGVIQDIQ